MNLNKAAGDDNIKLIVTIVNKSFASSVIAASKEGGAKGGTVMLGKGTCKKSFYTSFIPGNNLQERAIILTLVQQKKAEKVLAAIAQEVRLNEPCRGIAFMVNVKFLIGVTHSAELKDLCKEDGGNVMIENNINFDLIVTIVNKGFAEDVVEHSKKAGAEGGTIINGRGTGVHENLKLFGISIEPEKEIVLTLIPKDKTNQVLHAISDAVHLDKPSNGIAFVLDVEKTVGIHHLVNCCEGK